MTDVLVLDAHQHATLSVLRSLGPIADVQTTVATTSRFLPGAMSRHTDDRYVHEPLETNPDRYIRNLKHHIETVGYDAVIPITDPTSVVCSKRKEELTETGAAVGVEDWETFTRTYNKAETVTLASSLNVPVPETTAPESVSDVRALGDLTFPLVIKPRSKSRVTDEGEISLDKVTQTNYVTSVDELETQFKSMTASISDPDYFPLVQQRIDGEIRDTSLLAENGRIVAYVQNRRIRTYPKSGGGHTLNESLHSPEMRDYAERLVDALDWTGPVNFEFIYDGQNHYLIEINGRYWGSLALAVNCGVGIPRLHYQQLTGLETRRDEETQGDYEAGVRQRWLLPGDLLWLFDTLEDGEWGDVPQFFTSFYKADHDIPDLRDPLPTVGACLRIGQLGYAVVTGKRSIYGET